MRIQIGRWDGGLFILFMCDYNTAQACVLAFTLAWPWVWQNKGQTSFFAEARNYTKVLYGKPFSIKKTLPCHMFWIGEHAIP